MSTTITNPNYPTKTIKVLSTDVCTNYIYITVEESTITTTT